MLKVMYWQSNGIKGNCRLEKKDLNSCIKFLKDSKLEVLEVEVLVTDRYKQINKWLQEAYPKIKHYHDISWHVAKGTYLAIFYHTVE